MSHLFARTNNLYEFPYTSNLGLSGSGNNRTVIEKTYNGSSVIKLQPNTAYYMSGDRSTSQDVNCVIALFTSYPKIGSISKHFYYYNSTSQSGVEFTTESDETYGLIEHRSSLDYTTDYHMMLNVGTTALPYEPYRIERSLDHVYVKARTENLYNSAETDWEIGILDDDGNPTGSTTSHYTKNFTAVEPETSYYLSGTIYIGQSGHRIYYYDANKNWISRSVLLEYYNGNFTTPANCKYVRFQVSVYLESTSDWMLNTGSTALPYQPYLITKEAWEARTRVILHNLTNPLCGIGAYKDTLDLSTGTVTRYIKKLVLNGTESWDEGVCAVGYRFIVTIPSAIQSDTTVGVRSMCSHLTLVGTGETYRTLGAYTITARSELLMTLYSDTRLADWKSWLVAQYAAGNPVIVWYVLETPETETITVPSNLTGIVEGYLTQSSTPSPTSPVYPTANGTLEQGGTYSLDTGAYAIAWGRADTFTGTNSISARCYGLPIKSWEIDGNSQQNGTPAPDNPIYPQFVGDRTANLFDKNSMVVDYYLAKATGVYTATIGESHSVLVKVEPSTTYTITGTSWTKRIALFDNMPQNGDTPNYYSDNDTTAYEETSLTFMTLPTTQYLVFFNYSGATEYPNNKTLNNVMSSVMLNLGSTPLPYEPYGWAIEIEVT